MFKPGESLCKRKYPNKQKLTLVETLEKLYRRKLIHVIQIGYDHDMHKPGKRLSKRKEVSDMHIYKALDM